MGGGSNHYSGYGDMEHSSDGERHPLTVIKYSNGNNGNVHPSQKPVDLMQWLVRSYTNEGDRVLDPFCGSGSTGVAALREGRTFTGIEKAEEHVESARARCRAEACPPSMFVDEQG